MATVLRMGWWESSLCGGRWVQLVAFSFSLFPAGIGAERGVAAQLSHVLYDISTGVLFAVLKAV